MQMRTFTREAIRPQLRPPFLKKLPDSSRFSRGHLERHADRRRQMEMIGVNP
jgi:hypothetical protein